MRAEHQLLLILRCKRLRQLALSRTTLSLSRISLILEPWLDLVPSLFFWVGNPNVCGVAPSHFTSLYGIELQF